MQKNKIKYKIKKLILTKRKVYFMVSATTSLSPVEQNRNWPVSPSTKVKNIANLFINYLSKEQQPPIWPSFNKAPLISDNERDDIKTIFSSTTVQKLRNREEVESFYKVGKGKHHTVWGHPNYPNLVFKITHKQDAEKQEQVSKEALEVTRNMEQRSWVQIPRATSFDVEKLTVYVEERLPLNLNMHEHEEFWARIFTHYQSAEASPLFRQNLATLIDQIQELVEKVGIWDVGYKNLPEVRTDGSGVCGTDFENVDKRSVADGIQRLTDLFPISPLVDKLSKRYEKETPALYAEELEKYQQKVEDYKMFGAAEKIPSLKRPSFDTVREKVQINLEESRDKVQARQLAIQSYDQREYVSGNEPITIPNNLSRLSDDGKQLAEALIDKMNETLESLKDKNLPLTEKRHLEFQPGSGYNFKAGKSYSREEFIKALQALKEEGVIISWSDNYRYYEFVQNTWTPTTYDIFF